jgi:hypothetical protein
VAVRGRGGQPNEWSPKPAITPEVSTDSGPQKPAITGTVSTDLESRVKTLARSAVLLETTRVPPRAARRQTDGVTITSGMGVRLPIARVIALLAEVQATAELFPRTFWNFSREFSSFKRQGAPMGQRVYSSDRAIRFSRAVASRGTGLRVPVVERGSDVGDHAAASIDGHVPQATDRLASTRARRAAAAREVRSAGTASPVPKYISSGVCPRNAE